MASPSSGPHTEPGSTETGSEQPSWVVLQEERLSRLAGFALALQYCWYVLHAVSALEGHAEMVILQPRCVGQDM
jgi:hypothetical protein